MKSKSGVDAAQGRVSATVSYLPSAGLPTVENPRRAGRLPAGVTKLRPRPQAAPALDTAPPLDPLDAAGRMLGMVEDALVVARQRLAQYRTAAARGRRG